MIVNGILLMLQGIVEVLLSPLTALSFAVDLLSGFPAVVGFLKVVAYVLPWSNLLPIIFIIFAIIGFRTMIALLKTITSFIPFW